MVALVGLVFWHIQPQFLLAIFMLLAMYSPDLP
jgi:hypothetical protein